MSGWSFPNALRRSGVVWPCQIHMEGDAFVPHRLNQHHGLTQTNRFIRSKKKIHPGLVTPATTEMLCQPAACLPAQAVRSLFPLIHAWD